MKRKSWICFLVMCLTLLITTGCDTNREEDVNDGGINDNMICFSELFKDDVIVYTGFHKGDAPIGKDSEISLMKIFTTDGKEGMVTTYWLGSDRYRGRELGKFAKMQDDEILKSLVNTDGLRMYQEKEGEVAFYSKSEKWYHLILLRMKQGIMYPEKVLFTNMQDIRVRKTTCILWGISKCTRVLICCFKMKISFC